MFRRLFASRRSVTRSAHKPRALRFEALERREMLTTFTVLNKNDDGAGSLRQAIVDANDAGGADKIVFESKLSGKTIKLQSSLPSIDEDLTIQAPGKGQPVRVDGQGISGLLPITNGVATTTLKNLVITGGNRDNLSFDGGGVVNFGDLTLKNCVVSENFAGSHGGGIHNTGLLTLIDSAVVDNECVSSGGGISNGFADSVLVVNNSTISGNVANSGGGVRNLGQATFDNSTLSGNRAGIGTAAQRGGGIFNSGQASLQRTTVAGNVAFDGGGIESDGASASLVVRESTVYGNRAARNGGGVQIQNGTAALFNSTIAYNSAASGNGGGGIHIGGGAATIVNSTVAYNNDGSDSAGGAGGIAKVGGTLVLTNSIVSQNSAGPTSPDDNIAAADIDAGIGNFIGGDPRLGPLAANGGPTFSMVPFSDSPVIDNGNSGAATENGQAGGTPLTLDQLGNERIVDGNGDAATAVDQGAVEFGAGPAAFQEQRRSKPAKQGGPPLLTTFTVVNTDDAGSGSLRQAIEDANSTSGEDKIKFAKALSGETILIAASLPELLDDVVIQAPGKGAPRITIDGQGISGVRPFENETGVTATLKNLIITRGNVDGAGQDGGGIDNNGVLLLKNCTVTGNFAAARGGGIVNDGTLTLDNVIVSNNESGNGGGGIENGFEVVAMNSQILGNRTAGNGGGISTFGAATIDNSTIAGNRAAGDGGGLLTNGLGGKLLLRQSTVYGNRADGAGGGINFLNGEGTLLNSTVAYNSADGAQGGGGINVGVVEAVFVNCTIAHNSDTGNGTNGAGGIASVGSTLTLANCIVSQNTAAPGSVDDDIDVGAIDTNNNNFLGGNPELGPLANNGGPTFSMAPLTGSPVIDSGTNEFATETGLASGNALTVDQHGNPRIVDGNGDDVDTVDRGAIEFGSGPPAIASLTADKVSRRSASAASVPATSTDDLTFAAAVSEVASRKRQHRAADAVFALWGLAD